MKHRFVALLALFLISTACSSASDSPVADPEGSDTITTPSTEGGARTIASLFEDSAGDPEISAGEWFSDSFETAITFELPEAGRVRVYNRGFIAIEVGPIDQPSGSLELVEALAYDSPDGAVPLGADSNLEYITVVDEGVIDLGDRQILWSDLRLESALVPDSFQSDCPYPAPVKCSSRLLTASGGVSAQMDVTRKYFSQDLGINRLYVIANGDDGALDEMAIQLASSVSPAELVDDAARQPMTAIGLQGEQIPPGVWFAELDGTTVEISTDLPIDRMSVEWVDPSTLGIANVDNPGSLFIAVAFQGFPDPFEGPQPSPGAPLSAEDFLAGLGQILNITEVTETTVGGMDAVSWKEGPLDPDSPYACTPEQRGPADADATCIMWSQLGIQSFYPDDTPSSIHYIESQGLVIGWNWTGDETDSPFDQLVESLSIRASS